MSRWLSSILGDTKSTLSDPVDDCVAFGRESRKSFGLGEVRMDRLGEAVAEAEFTGIDGKRASGWECVDSDR